MKKRLQTTILLIPTLLILMVGCANVGVASSWPGMTQSDDIAFVSYNRRVFAVDSRNGSEIWRFPAEEDNRYQYFAAPTIEEDLMVVGSYGERLVSVDVHNGQQKWTFDGAQDRYIGSALIKDGKIYAPNTDGFLYALNREGNLLWKFSSSGPNWTSPITDGEFIFMASMDHFLYAFQTDYPSGQLVQDKNGQLSLVSEPLWKVDLGAAVVAEPVLADGLIIVGTIDGNLHAVNIAEQEITWTFNGGEAAASIWGAPVVTKEAIFYGDEKGNLYAVSRDDGTALWPSPYSAGSSLIGGGVETENGILFISEEGKIFTINVDKVPRPVTSLGVLMYATPLYIDGCVIIAPATKEALLQAYDLEGKEIWKFIPSE